MLEFLQILLSFSISLAANGATSLIQKERQKALDKALEDKGSLKKALTSRKPLRDEVKKACIELARNRATLKISPQEKPLWLLLNDDIFQNDVAEWLMAGAIEEGDKAKARLLQSMTSALSTAGAPEALIHFLNTEYFDALERSIFTNRVLASWRHQMSLDYLREQVTTLRVMAEEAAGKYSPGKQKDALDSYCEKALRAWDIIDLINLPEGDTNIATQGLLLRQLYMPLRLTVEVTREQGDDDTAFAKLEEERETRRQLEAGWHATGKHNESNTKEHYSVGERLNSAQKLVVLGDPGGGKTTMMRWMATAYLLRYRKEPAFDEIPDSKTLPEKNWIPVLIRCRDLGEEDLCRSFSDFLTQHLKKTELLPDEADVMSAVILQSIAKGKALLLVDGLDEITNPNIRMMFCQELERTAARYPEAHIVVTSRIVGYRDMPYRMGAGFEHGVIAELTRDDKDRFAKRWIEVTEQHRSESERTQRAQDLLEALHSSDRIERLTGNPMLLTTLALVKRKVGKLPTRRAALYAEAVEVLLNWNPIHYEAIDKNEAIPQLEYLAYEMCRRGVQRLTEDEVLDLLDKLRVEYPNVRAIKQRDSHVFLELLEARSSILIKSGGDWLKRQGEEKPVWEFRHLTFQEYLAAKALLDGRYPNRDRSKSLADQVAPLAGSVRETSHMFGGRTEFVVIESWQEALRLLVTECNDDDVDEVLRSIATPLDGENSINTTRPRAILAARCLADEPNVSPDTAEGILIGFAQQVSPNDGRRPMRSSLELAALELGRCHWTAPLLKDCLINEYLHRKPRERLNTGRLCGLVEMATAPVDSEAFAVWFNNLFEQLNLKNEIETTTTVLTIMHAAYTRNTPVTQKQIDKLLSLFSLTKPICEAAAGTLFWLNKRARLAKDRVHPTWSPTIDEIRSLIDILSLTPLEEVTTRTFLIQILGNTQDKQAVGPLIECLHDPDSSIRYVVIDALGEIGDKQAVGPLIECLYDPDYEHHLEVVYVLGILRDRQAGGPLLEFLDDPNSDVQRSVIKVLGMIRYEQAQDPLIERLSNNNPDIQKQIIQTLRKIGNERAIDPLINLLDDPNFSVKSNAAATLEHLGDARGSIALKEHLHDANPSLRIAAVEAFAQLKDFVEQSLLSVDIDAIGPWIDPQETITEGRVTDASTELDITMEEVRSCYESLADDIGLKMSWIV